MARDLMIEVYPSDQRQSALMDEFLQTLMAEHGVCGLVSICYALPSLLAGVGIAQLPAIRINKQVVLQGRLPTRAEVVAWFDGMVPEEHRAPRRGIQRIVWPRSVDEAVNELIQGMRDSDKLLVCLAGDEALVVAAGPIGWGQAIRNAFGLWAGNAALLQDCGTDSADDASLVIIRAVRDRLRQTLPQYTDR